ncbi:MAG: hypothetical protein QM706_06275 [Nitrospira sp.]
MRSSSILSTTIPETSTLTLYNTPDVTGTITIDGATVSPTLTVPGQRARYSFAGTAGQWVNLGLTAVSISSSTVSILKPDGTTLRVVGPISTSGGSIDPTTALPTTGTYTIVVDPTGLATGSMTLTLSLTAHWHDHARRGIGCRSMSPRLGRGHAIRSAARADSG